MADFDGKRTLRLTPYFTPPADPAFAYAEFWARRGDSGTWHLLGYPSKGGPADVAIINELPTVHGDWLFRFIAKDVNGKDRDGKVNSDPANPPVGTPEFTLHIDPPAAGSSGVEWTDNVIGFAGAGAAGAAIEYRTNVDGVEQWRVCLAWTRPAATTFGGIKPVVRFNPGTGASWDNPLGYTGPDEPLPWRSGWFDMGATATAEIYAVAVAVAGQRENTLVPGTTPRIAGLTIAPQTTGSLKGGRIDTTTPIPVTDGAGFTAEYGTFTHDGETHHGIKLTGGSGPNLRTILIHADAGGLPEVSVVGQTYTSRVTPSEIRVFQNGATEAPRASMQAGVVSVYQDDLHGVLIEQDGSVTINGSELNTKFGNDSAGADSSGALTCTGSYQDIPGASVELSKSGTWLIEGVFDLTANLDAGTVEGALNVGASQQARTVKNFAAYSGTLSRTWAVSVDASGGAVTAKLEAKKSSTGMAMINTATITAVWLHG